MLGAYVLFLSQSSGLAPAQAPAAPTANNRGKLLPLVPLQARGVTQPRLNGGHPVAASPLSTTTTPSLRGPAGLGGALSLVRIARKVPYLTLVPAYSAPAPIINTIAAQLGGLQASATGSEVFSGTVAATLGGLTCSASGSVQFSGTIVAHLGGLRCAAVGSEVFSGTVVAHLGGLRCAAVGSEVFSGTVAARLGGLRCAAVGAEVFSGTVVAHLGGLRCAAVGSEAFPGTVTAHLGGLRCAAVGSEVFSGTVAAHLGGILVAASGRPIPVFPITFAASTSLLSTLQSSRASTDMAANDTAALAMSPASTWMDRLGALPA